MFPAKMLHSFHLYTLTYQHLPCAHAQARVIEKQAVEPPQCEAIRATQLSPLMTKPNGNLTRSHLCGI